MTGSSLYTILLEFRGGTYISQATGENASSVLSQWISQLDEKDLSAWGLDRDTLVSIHAATTPMALTGRINVWCLSGIAGKRQVLINIIKTAA
jgi:hypothetical protein